MFGPLPDSIQGLSCRHVPQKLNEDSTAAYDKTLETSKGLNATWAHLDALRTLCIADRALSDRGKHDTERIDCMLRQLLYIQVAGVAMADVHDEYVDDTCDGVAYGVGTEAGLHEADLRVPSCKGDVSSKHRGQDGSNALPCQRHLHGPMNVPPTKYLHWKKQVVAAIRACKHLPEKDRTHALAQIELASARWHAMRCQPQAWLDQIAHVPADIKNLEHFSGLLPAASSMVASLEQPTKYADAAACQRELPTKNKLGVGRGLSHGQSTIHSSRSPSPEKNLLAKVKRAKARAGHFRCMHSPPRIWDDSTLLSMEMRHKQSPSLPEGTCSLPRHSTAVHSCLCTCPTFATLVLFLTCIAYVDLPSVHLNVELGHFVTLSPYNSIVSRNHGCATNIRACPCKRYL
jgi:hypothetical protein